MNYYDNQLREMQEKVARKKKIEVTLEDLYKQKRELHSKVVDLENIKIKEQKDVDKIENGNILVFFYQMIGKKEEKLDKEKQEAFAATAKYNLAVRELEYIKDSIRMNEDELDGLAECEATYEKALEAKKSSLKSSMHIKAKELLALEEEICAIRNQKKELEEAKDAGLQAKQQVNRVLETLKEAEDLGIWDTWGGGMLVDMAKHNALDDAQYKVEELQQILRDFKTELADVTIDADFKVNLDDFTRFGDWFFDNIFTDYNVLEQIRQSEDKMYAVLEQIEGILNNLNKLSRCADDNITNLNNKIETLLITTTL